jgi:quercetin dioxygenase-like cupin family protein
MQIARRGGGVIEALPGRTWTGLVADEAETGGLRIGLASYPPGGEAPSSMHDDEDEILVPLQGRATLIGSSAEETLEPGDVALVPAGEQHAIHADPDVGLEVVAIFVRRGGGRGTAETAT